MADKLPLVEERFGVSVASPNEDYAAGHMAGRTAQRDADQRRYDIEVKVAEAALGVVSRLARWPDASNGALVVPLGLALGATHITADFEDEKWTVRYLGHSDISTSGYWDVSRRAATTNQAALEAFLEGLTKEGPLV